MNATPDTEKKGAAHSISWRFILFVTAACVTAVTLLSLVLSGGGYAPSDGDGWMHGLRIMTWLAGRDPDFVANGNSPYGFIIHWTMPFDWLLIALSAPFRLFLANSEATLWGMRLSHWPSCVLAVSAALAFGQGVALRFGLPGAKSRVVLAAGALSVFLSPMYYSYGLPTRVDHHILVLGLAFLAGAFVVSAVSWRGMAIGGAVAGLSAWASVEALPGLVIILAAAVITRNISATLKGSRDDFSPSAMLGAMTAVMLLAVLMDPPFDGNRFDIDRISLVHLFPASLAFLLALVGDFGPGRPVRNWSIWKLAILGAVTVAATLLLFPQILAGPETVIGPFLTEKWWSGIREIQPVPSFGQGMMYFGASAGSLVAVLVLAALIFAKGERLRAMGITLVALTLGAFLLATCAHIRFLPWTLMAGVSTMTVLIAGFRVMGPRPLMLWFLISAMLPVGFTIQSVSSSGKIASEGRSGEDGDLVGIGRAGVNAKRLCRAEDLAAFLKKEDVDVNTVIMPDRLVPEILFGEPWIGTIAGSYQRNVEGLEDHFRFLLDESGNAVRALEIAGKRNVSHVAICAMGSRQDGNSLVERLRTGDVPSWLEPAEAEVEGSILEIFRVR